MLFVSFCSTNALFFLLPYIAHGCSHGTVTFMNRTTLSTSFGSMQSGAVVICINGQWSFVCSNKWSHTVAKVTCVDMGLSHYGKRNLLLRALNSKYLLYRSNGIPTHSIL